MRLSKQEKIERIKEWNEFPNRLVYSIAKNLEDGTLTILATALHDKKKELRNVKFKETDVIVFGYATAPVGVHDVESAEQVIKITEHYRKMWDLEEAEYVIDDPELLEVHHE